MGGGNKPIIMHFHPILTITVDGKPMTVPGQIGIDLGPMEKSFFGSIWYASNV